MEAVLIFPHQLFWPHPALKANAAIYLVEESLFFTQYPFHLQKLVLHRASMRSFADRLRSRGFTVHYVEATEKVHDARLLVSRLAEQGISVLTWVDTADNWLEGRLAQAAKKCGLTTHVIPSPNFITTTEECTDFFSKRKRYFQTDFYIWQRKQHRILVNARLEPEGGKWSFDDENREKFRGQITVPPVAGISGSLIIKEAIQYVQKHFPANPGELTSFQYPVTHEDAESWLMQFLEKRFLYFGTYEDAMVPSENVLFHSVLTPMLNIGLLDPWQVVNKALAHASQNHIPLNSVEGFIRQVIGWREFIRAIYTLEGTRQRTTNFFGYTRKIPPSFWNATTGIAPVDIVIRHVLREGYTHHINRLMVLGNFMLLCEFDPDDVYRWFMELFVDSYDWVMVPNVYGMTQFADGGLMTTKPYISGSNYLMKMGTWPKGPWQQTWDALFWRFVHVHRNLLGQNQRLGMMVRTFDKFSEEKRKILLSTAEEYLATIP